MRKTQRHFLHVFGLALVLIALSGPALSQTFMIFSPTNIAQGKLLYRLSYHYSARERPSISELLKDIEDSRILETDWENAQYPIVGFLSQVFAAEPEHLAKEISPRHGLSMKKAILLALMMEFLDVYAPLSYQQIINKVPQDKRPPHIGAMSVKHPKQLDMLWGALFASGDPKFFDAILAVYNAPEGPSSDPKHNLAMRRVIEWAIWSNMQQHVLVERLMRMRTASATHFAAERMRKIVSRFETSLESLNLGTRDGFFSASVSLTDASIIDELKKPPSSSIRVVKKSRFSRGEEIFVHIAFNGMEVSESLEADVTFSSTLRLPDGHEQNFTEDRTAIVGPAPVRYIILTARDLHQFRLPDNAPSGDYVLRVTLSDNLSGKDLELEAPFTLVE